MSCSLGVDLELSPQLFAKLCAKFETGMLRGARPSLGRLCPIMSDIELLLPLKLKEIKTTRVFLSDFLLGVDDCSCPTFASWRIRSKKFAT